MSHNQPPNDDERIFNFPWFQGNNPSGQQGSGPPFWGAPDQSWGGPYGGPPNVPGGQQQVSPPNSPPPSFTPQQPMKAGPGGISTYAVDPGAIRGCLFRFTYIWLRWDAFWFYPVFIGPRSIAGFRWRRNRWVYYGIDLDNVQSFQCF